MKAKLTVIAIAVVITVLFLGFAQFSYAQQNTTFEEKNATQAKAKGTTVEKYKQTLKEYESPTGKKWMQPQEGRVFREMMERKFKGSSEARMKEFIEFLNLSEEQSTKIKEIFLDFQKNAMVLRNRIQINELEVKALLLEPETELVKVREKLTAIADLQVELKMTAIEKYLVMKELLTPEQQEILPLGIPFQAFDSLKNFGTNHMMNRFNR